MRIQYTSYSDGQFPDVTDIPVEQWLTVQKQVAGNCEVIEIDAVAEHNARFGEDAPKEKRISWQEYFGWLSGLPEGKTKPWNVLKDAIEKRFSGRAIKEPEPARTEIIPEKEEIQKVPEQVKTHEPLPQIPQQQNETPDLSHLIPTGIII